MRAAVLHQLDQPLRIESGIEVPELRSGQVLVSLAYSGVCHSQLMEARGRRGPDRYLPHMLGHEGSGTVLEIGNAVTKVGPGDKVILGWMKGNGIDAGGTVYQKGHQSIHAGPVTTLSEYAVVSENRCVALPDGIPMDTAVLFGCAVPTGVGMVTNTIAPRDGSTVAIFGLGGVGLSALMATSLFDCARVIAVDVVESKLDIARELGATDLINGKEQNPVQAILDITEGRGVDYSIETAGLTATIEQAFESVRNQGGLCVFASHPEHGHRVRLDPHDLISGKRIEGSWGGASDPDRDVPRFAELYRMGKLPLGKLISRRYGLEEVNSALRHLEGREIGRPLIEISRDHE